MRFLFFFCKSKRSCPGVWMRPLPRHLQISCLLRAKLALTRTVEDDFGHVGLKHWLNYCCRLAFILTLIADFAMRKLCFYIVSDNNFGTIPHWCTYIDSIGWRKRSGSCPSADTCLAKLLHADRPAYCTCTFLTALTCQQHLSEFKNTNLACPSSHKMNLNYIIWFWSWHKYRVNTSEETCSIFLRHHIGGNHLLQFNKSACFDMQILSIKITRLEDNHK